MAKLIGEQLKKDDDKVDTVLTCGSEVCKDTATVIIGQLNCGQCIVQQHQDLNDRCEPNLSKLNYTSFLEKYGSNSTQFKGLVFR